MKIPPMFDGGPKSFRNHQDQEVDTGLATEAIGMGAEGLTTKLNQTLSLSRA